METPQTGYRAYIETDGRVLDLSPIVAPAKSEADAIVLLINARFHTGVTIVAPNGESTTLRTQFAENKILPPQGGGARIHSRDSSKTNGKRGI